MTEGTYREVRKTKKISEESVRLIRKYLPELGLTFPLDDDDGGYRILKFFEAIDADIGGMIDKGKEVDPVFNDDVNRIIGEFLAPDEPIDYDDLERRLRL